MEPRFAINVTTTWDWDLAQCADAWVRKGVPAIGLGAQLCEDYGRLETVQLIKDSGLKGSTFAAINPSSMSVHAIESTLDLAASVEADCVYVITGERKAPLWENAIEVFQEDFAPVRHLARDRGLRLAIEPIHPLRQDLSFVNTARDANRILAEIGDSNVGYVFDFWHLWWSAGVLDAIVDSGPQSFSVQVSDHKPITMRSLDRTVPGEGLIPCVELMKTLEASGYARYYEAEVITDDNRVMGYEQALDRVIESWERLWSETQA